MKHIFNLSFTPLDEKAIGLLSKTGLTRDAEWDEKSSLPFLRPDLEPEEIEDMIAERLAEMDIHDDDIVIVGGVPDVVFYIEKFLDIEVTILTMLGRKNKNNGQFNIQGFREIIRGDRPKGGMKAIHVTQPST